MAEDWKQKYEALVAEDWEKRYELVREELREELRQAWAERDKSKLEGATLTIRVDEEKERSTVLLETVHNLSEAMKNQKS